jgi:predicted Zn-dependent protease
MRWISRPGRDSARAVRLVFLLALSAVLVAGPALASISTERKVGEEFAREARRGLPLIHDYELLSLIREMGNKLVETLGNQPFDYEFFVVAEDSINAFAVPGGKIFVHAGLISRVGTEDEVADVLAHEIAHANAHHAVRQQQKSAVANYASLLGIFLGAINPVLGQAAIAAALGQSLKYQRDFEREADFLGVSYAKKAGYDPGAMLRMLRVIYDEQRINPASIPPYFQSHPLTGERLAYLESTLKENEWQQEAPPPTWRFLRAQAIATAYSRTRRTAVPPYERRLANASEKERPGALELIGLLMCHGEDYDMAIHYLEQADKLGRHVDRELGRAYLRKGQLDQARPRLEHAVAEHPDDWNALADLGELEYQSGHFDAAVERLRKARELYPYLPSVDRSLGRALDKDGHTGEGFYYFAKAAEFEGDSAQALTYYRKAAEDLGDDNELSKDIQDRITDLEKEASRPGPPQIRPGQR